MEEEHVDYQNDKNNHLNMDGIEEAKDMTASDEPGNTSSDHKASEVCAPQDQNLWDRNSPTSRSREDTRILHKEGILPAVEDVKLGRVRVQAVVSSVSFYGAHLRLSLVEIQGWPKS